MGHMDSPPHLNGVVVGLDQIYQQMLAMIQQQAQLTGKIDGFIMTWSSQAEVLRREISRVQTEQLERHNDLKTKYEEHEKRLLELQTKRFLEPKDMRAGIAILLTALGLAVSIIAMIVKG